jgi:putative hydrolase of the HAD superfamily
MYKEFFKGKKAAIFDLDGTIVKETIELRKQAYEKVLKEINFGYIDFRPYFGTGYPSDTIWEAILGAYGIKGFKVKDLVEKTRVAYLEILKNETLEPTEGFWDIVYELKKEKDFQLALVTNSPRQTQELVIEKLELKGVFDIEIFGDDVRKRKPNPEIFNKAIKELKVKPNEAIIFEDSIPGVEAAKKANIDVIVIWDGETKKDLYESNPLEFSEDFTPYPGSLDNTHLEYLVKSYEEAKKTK